MSTEERITVELEAPIFISATLQDFRGWLESYLKHKYSSRSHLSSPPDNKYPDADTLGYLNFGGQICIRIEHLSAEDLSLFLFASNIRAKDSHEVKIHLKTLQKDIVARWANSTVENPSTNSNALNIFNELMQKVEQLTLEDAKISGKQLAKRIQSALNKYPEHHLTEFNKFKNRFYSPHAGKNYLLSNLERDKRETIGILEQILDEIQFEQDEILNPSDFVLEVRPLFGEPLSEDVQDWADVFVIMPFRDKFIEIYKNHIHKVVESENMSCAYGGEVDSVNAFITDVWSSIYHSKFCIAECTGNNPNVFYEIGIARTLGRQCILITQNDENDMPANLRHLKFIHYSPDRLVEFEDMLKKRIASVKRSSKQ